MKAREYIKSYQDEILKGNLLPQRAAEILTEISALIGVINEEITKVDIAYNLVLLNELETAKTASTAKIKANTTPQYEEMRTARNTKELAVEMMRSLKYLLKSMEEDYKAGQFQ